MTAKSEALVELRRSTVILMADGRERTATDVAKRLKVSSATAGQALGQLVKMGLLSSEVLKIDGNVTLYRKPQEASDGQA